MTGQQRSVVVGILALVAGLIIGAAWQGLRNRPMVRDLAETREQLRLQELEATLGAATIEAQRGNYEIARRLTSDFFTGLQGSTDIADDQQRAAFAEMLNERDAMITSLSRGDAQSGSMLAQLFFRYRIAMGKPVGSAAMPAPPAAVPEPPAEAPRTGE